MQIVNWAVFIAFAMVWTWVILRFAQWRDLHADKARARQEQMGVVTWVKTNTIAKLGRITWKDSGGRVHKVDLAWGAWLGGLALLAWLVWKAPYAITGATSVAVLIAGLRQTDAEPGDIIRLRSALADIMKTDQPPKVTVDGDTLTIAGHINFKEYQKAQRDAMENAIEYRLDGDWEFVDFRPDGSGYWERVIHPPEKVAYIQHLDYPWHQVPVGPDGHGDMAVMDLRRIPHWLIAGATRHGKTSALRVALAHLLRFDVEVVALDYKGGLSFLRDRAKVRACATRDIDKIAATLAGVVAEIEERADLFDQGKPYRKPLVVACDEVAAMCERADHAPKTVEAEVDGKKVQVPNPTRQLTANLETAIRLAAQGLVFFLLSTQRPSAKSIPIEVRDQAEGRLAIGPMGDEAAQMMFENEYGRATSTPNIPGRLVFGEMHGHGNTWRQGFWLADPNDPDHDNAERDLADNLLPPKVRIADSSMTDPATFGQSGDTHRIETKSKREPSGPTTAPVTVNGVVTGPVTEETPYERTKRVWRENKARQRKRDREASRNPDWEHHGTKRGWASGCPCNRCRAWSDHRVLESVS